MFYLFEILYHLWGVMEIKVVAMKIVTMGNVAIKYVVMINVAIENVAMKKNCVSTSGDKKISKG